MNVSREKYKNLKKKAEDWYNYSQKLLETKKDLEQATKEMETEIKSLKKTIRHLEKENKSIIEEYSSKIASLERESILKDGKIQQLKDAKDDLGERYKELKDDYRWFKEREKTKS